jgi:lipoate-protein ligase A
MPELELPIHNLMLINQWQKDKITIIMEEVMQALEETPEPEPEETLEQVLEEMLEQVEMLEQEQVDLHLHENNRRKNSDIYKIEIFMIIK